MTRLLLRQGDRTARGGGDRYFAGAAGLAAEVAMFGGGPARNMAVGREGAARQVRPGDPGLNIKWAADLGSQSYGGPLVADGRIFIGTNNEKPAQRPSSPATAAC